MEEDSTGTEMSLMFIRTVVVLLLWEQFLSRGEDPVLGVFS